MFEATDSEHAPWWTIDSEDKRAARLNVINHLTSEITYENFDPEPVKIPKRPSAENYQRPPLESQRFVPDVAARLKP